VVGCCEHGEYLDYLIDYCLFENDSCHWSLLYGPEFMKCNELRGVLNLPLQKLHELNVMGKTYVSILV
jgi:hypothetical protein